ncbi:MAG: GNAT family N-acetyltransferase [Gammaproteobacteria bacterium]|nr:GNAT family N-acetyltransferase [Gammaproteobacteria bacterium]
MGISIRFLQKPLTDQQRCALFGWDNDVFQAARYQLEWQPKTAHLLLYDDASLASHVGLLQHRVVVDEQSYRVGGVGGVVTLPHQQGKGYASALMEEACRRMAAWHVDAGLLFCRPQLQKFYSRRDWTMVTAPVTVHQAERIIEMPVQAMVKPVNLAAWPSGPVHVPGLPW